MRVNYGFGFSTFWGEGHDVISWKKCCHLVSAWTRSVCRSPCSSVPPVPDISLYQIRTCFIIFWTPRFSVSRLHIFVGLTPPLFYTCGAVIRYDQTDYCGINFVSVLSHRLCLFDVYMRSCSNDVRPISVYTDVRERSLDERSVSRTLWS